jgi:UBA/TS-N domain
MEFNAQRQDAIAEATSGIMKKKFGGGNKILADSNVQKILEKGFDENQAITALKYSKNNLEKALNNLKKREERQNRVTKIGNESVENPKKCEVSLFDFLEKKISKSAGNVKPSIAEYHLERNASFGEVKHDREFKNNENAKYYSNKYSSFKNSTNISPSKCRDNSRKSEFYNREKDSFNSSNFEKKKITDPGAHQNYESFQSSSYPPLTASNIVESSNNMRKNADSGFQKKKYSDKEQSKNDLKLRKGTALQHQQYSTEGSYCVSQHASFKIKGSTQFSEQPLKGCSVLQGAPKAITDFTPNQTAVFHMNPKFNSRITQNTQPCELNIGDACLAKYWEDGKVILCKKTSTD